MPSPTSALEMMISAARGAGGPVARGDMAMMSKQAEAMKKQQMEQQAMQKFQAGLQQRLNPRIGTKDDTDPQFNPMLQLMMKLRGGMQQGGMLGH